jgi:hypothetical protein
MEFRLAVILMVVIYLLAGCGSSENGGTFMQSVPVYPYASENEAMQHADPDGLMGGKLTQYTTGDTFDQVVDYYASALEIHEPRIASHASELGRQTAFSIAQDGGIASVVIQEFARERSVSITVMQVGG